MKIGILYFSGTHVTALVAGAVQRRLEELGAEAELRDITPLRKRRDIDTDTYDALILGFPVYSDFAPSVINEWLMTLEGRGRPCALFCTYGGRTSGYFHYHTWQILKERGFSVLMSAEFLGRHTFNLAGWNVLPGRPNEEDLKVAADLADRAVGLFASESPELLSLQKPLGYKE
ncbi:MAG: flavodoxin family protein, partial [Spirochaetales bacterium]|nr:flavodoxin family protein [Spirochaetales bacterium]